MIESKAYIPFHKVSIADNSGIGINAQLCAMSIGNNVMKGPDTYFIGKNHYFRNRHIPMKRQDATEDKPIVIGDDYGSEEEPLSYQVYILGRGLSSLQALY